ncbi:MAG: GPW/gp25 family protein [Nitrospira sp.]
MAKTFLGVGCGFPILERQDAHVGCRLAEYENSVAVAIRLILSTAKGERVMRPDFGCGIHDLVFAVTNQATCDRAAAEVREALTRWEPRLDVENVRAWPSEEGTTLFIHVRYQVRATNNVFNLVYPFYLEGHA